MGKIFKIYIEGSTIYVCAECHTHLAILNDIVSTAFRGRTGQAYLFGNVVNVTHGPEEQRRLATGLHTVCDIYCSSCNNNVGWFYAEAFEESQKYKEGKYIIEKNLMRREHQVEETVTA